MPEPKSNCTIEIYGPKFLLALITTVLLVWFFFCDISPKARFSIWGRDLVGNRPGALLLQGGLWGWVSDGTNILDRMHQFFTEHTGNIVAQTEPLHSNGQLKSEWVKNHSTKLWSLFLQKSTYSRLFLHILNAPLCTQSGSLLFVKNFRVDFIVGMPQFWMLTLECLDVCFAYINHRTDEKQLCSYTRQKRSEIWLERRTQAANTDIHIQHHATGKLDSGSVDEIHIDRWKFHFRFFKNRTEPTLTFENRKLGFRGSV